VIDDLVVKAFFEAIQPAQLDALEAILASQRADRDRLERQWQDQLKRAQYEAHLAQRQYDAVDPQNRLVAAELEHRWEAKLQQFRQMEEDYHHFQQIPMPDTIPPAFRDLFREVSRKLPELWPSLSNCQKKELLRSLIQQVIIRHPAPDQVQVRVVWISGCFTDHTGLTPIHRERDVSRFDQLVARIQELWGLGYNDRQMADQLTTEGFHSARSAHVTADSVMKIRLARKWYLPLEQLRGADEMGDYLTVNGLAKRIGANESSTYRFIYRGIIPASDVVRGLQTGVYLIRNDEQLIDLLRQRVEKNKRRNGMLKSPPLT